MAPAYPFGNDPAKIARYQRLTISCHVMATDQAEVDALRPIVGM